MSKWFRVATEGATTDGRTITRKWIEEMAKNFNPAKYGARIWMEHMRGLFHDGPFAALGDVLAAKAEEVDGKLALFVQLDPTDKLKEINKDRQKVYTSIELDTDFADTGEAYLVGLAVTDSPAVLGTEMLQFSQQQGDKSPLAHRKQRPGNLFTVAVETELDFSQDEDDSKESKKPSLLDSVKAMFTRQKDTAKQDFSEFRADLEKTLGLFVDKFAALEASIKSLTSSQDFESLKADTAALRKEYDEFYSKIDNTPDSPVRRPATGGDGAVLTDC